MHRAVVLVCLAATTARADDVTLRAGTLDARVSVEINAAHNYWAQPSSLAPDVYWGATDALTVGLAHSHASLDRFEPGASVCVRTDPLYCDSTYRGSIADARYLVRDGTLQLAPRVRAMLRDIDPVKPAFTFGALAQWRRGRFAVVADPYLQIGLASTSQGNRAAVVVPIELVVQPTSHWDLSFQSGWNSELAIVRDGWHVPVATGVRFRAFARWQFGAVLGFASLIGPQNTPKQRSVVLGVAYQR